MPPQQNYHVDAITLSLQLLAVNHSVYLLCSHVQTTSLSGGISKELKGLAVLSHDLADHLSSAVRLTIFWKSPTYFLEMPV